MNRMNNKSGNKMERCCTFYGSVLRVLPQMQICTLQHHPFNPFIVTTFQLYRRLLRDLICQLGCLSDFFGRTRHEDEQ